MGLAAAVHAICEARTTPGEAAERLDEATEALASYRQAGYQLGVTALYVLLSRALLATGEPRRALETAEHGARFAAENSEKLFHAELLRLKAEALCRQLDPSRRSEAEALLGEALGIARGQSARSIELGVARSLAALDRDNGLAALRAALEAMSDGAALPEVIEAEALCRAGGASATDRA